MIRTVITAALFVFTAAYVYVRKGRIIVWSIIGAVLSGFYFLAYSNYSLPLTASLAVLIAALFAASFEDIRSNQVRTVHLALVLFSCAGVRFFLSLPPLYSVLSVATGLLALLVPWLISRGKWVGTGDVILFPCLCLTLEPLSVPLVIILGGITGILFFLVTNLAGRKTRRIPFIPLLSAAYLLYYPFQYQLLEFLFWK